MQGPQRLLLFLCLFGTMGSFGAGPSPEGAGEGAPTQGWPIAPECPDEVPYTANCRFADEDFAGEVADALGALNDWDHAMCAQFADNVLEVLEELLTHDIYTNAAGENVGGFYYSDEVRVAVTPAQLRSTGAGGPVPPRRGGLDGCRDFFFAAGPAYRWTGARELHA